jgi:hypothetical protein
MNNQISEIAKESGLDIEWIESMKYHWVQGTQEDLLQFVELLLKKTFTIIAESMIDTDADLKIDEIIADRLDAAAVDVCDELGITNAIYRGE